jgi:hypothetical protein
MFRVRWSKSFWHNPGAGSFPRAFAHRAAQSNFLAKPFGQPIQVWEHRAGGYVHGSQLPHNRSFAFTPNSPGCPRESIARFARGGPWGAGLPPELTCPEKFSRRPFPEKLAPGSRDCLSPNGTTQVPRRFAKEVETGYHRCSGMRIVTPCPQLGLPPLLNRKWNGAWHFKEEI